MYRETHICTVYMYTRKQRNISNVRRRVFLPSVATSVQVFLQQRRSFLKEVNLQYRWERGEMDSGQLSSGRFVLFRRWRWKKSLVVESRGQDTRGQGSGDQGRRVRTHKMGGNWKPCKEEVFFVTKYQEFIYEVSLFKVIINTIFIYAALTAWQNNHSCERIHIVLGPSSWNLDCIPFCGGDVRKGLAFHLAPRSGEVYAEPHRNVVGASRDKRISPTFLPHKWK